MDDEEVEQKEVEEEVEEEGKKEGNGGEIYYLCEDSHISNSHRHFASSE